MLQVLPLLVHGLVDDELTKLVCCACELAMRIYTRNRPAGFTQAGLDAIDAEIVKLRDTLSRLYAADATGTPKFHKLAHLTTDIKRNGHPENYNSDLYEADHCPLKEIYRWGQFGMRRSSVGGHPLAFQPEDVAVAITQCARSVYRLQVFFASHA
jgi:hypothetical protein